MLIVVSILALVFSSASTAQPMSGNYTVGGSSPEFPTLQNAADSLRARGVSGPVIFQIRPGLYTEQSGGQPVMLLEQAVPGVSATNTITFQPDAASGGNVNNVILRVQGDGNPPAGGMTAIGVNVDYVTISSLTVQDMDTSGNFATALIRLRGRSGQTSMTGIHITNCRLIGSPVFNESPSSPAARGTTNGIWLAKQSIAGYVDLVLNDNYIERVNYGCFVNAGVSLTNVNIQRNTMRALFDRVDGNGNHGAGIHCDRIDASENLAIIGNTIDFEGGNGAPASGIALLTSGSFRYIKAVIDGNYILSRPGKSSGGTFQTNVFSAINVGSSLNSLNDIVVSNNMIAGNNIRQPGGAIGTRKGIAMGSNNGKLFHNTIVNPFMIVAGGSNEFSRAIELKGPNMEVTNNIVVDYARGGNTVAYGIYDTTGLVSDHNIFDITSLQPLAFVGGTGSSSNFVYNLGGLQAKTGTDSNSLVKTIEFNSNTDLHLTDCQMQDPDLTGIPVLGITLDIDGDARSATGPTIGADEAVINNTRFWVDQFRDSLAGSPFSIAAGIFDNLIGDGIAVADFDNNQIQLYHSAGRSFVRSGTLSTDFVPVSLLFHDLDNDGHLDLIAGGYNPGRIKVFWGDGIGGFPATSELETPGVSNMIPGFSISGFRPILVPIGEVFGYLLHLGNRQLCFDLQFHGQFVDTLGSFIHSATTGDINGDDTLEVVGIGVTDGKFAFWNDIRTPLVVPPPPCGFVFDRFGRYTDFQFQTATYSDANSIVKGDFDRDGDLDFITTSGLSIQLLFIRNQGNFTFSAESISVDDFPRALATMDYDNDGDLDFVSANSSPTNGITLFINDGAGHFTQTRGCFQNLINGTPYGIVAKDFDVDGRTDIAVVTSFDQLFVLYNEGTATAVTPQPTDHVPVSYVLAQNYPNPFNPVTRIEYALPQASHVRLTVYNVLGQLVATLVDEERPAGRFTAQWNAASVGSGVYFYKLDATPVAGKQPFTSVKKMLMLK
jgi:hypothetical protein